MSASNDQAAKRRVVQMLIEEAAWATHRCSGRRSPTTHCW